jgi:hypothetical protein
LPLASTFATSRPALVLRLRACSIYLSPALVPNLAQSYRSNLVDTIHKTRPNLRSAIPDRGVPVHSMPVEISPAISHYILHRHRAITENQGVARFSAVRPWQYVASTQNQIHGSGVVIEVTSSQADEGTLQLRWPEPSPIVTGSLRGAIRLAAWPADLPQPGLQLAFRGANRCRLLRIGTNDSQGHFAFPQARPGPYSMEVTSPQSSHWSSYSVELNPLVSEAPLPVISGPAPCGVHEPRSSGSTCPTLQLGRLAGRLMDPSGASIPGTGT